MLEHYGEQLQRIPIDPGFGCPNRDINGKGGCTFCAEDGGRAIQTLKAGNWREQISTAVEFARDRYGARRFIGYVQAYSGSFAVPGELNKFFSEVLAYARFEAFIIGTRPDCLPPATLALLKKLAERTELWIELGIQTARNATLERINRGHTWEQSREAVLRLHNAGIKCTAHLIFGLPGEDENDFRHSAEAIAALPVSGIKFHNLHIIKGTALADEFMKNPFPVMDEHDYAEVLIDAISRMPPHIPIMRLQSDTPAERLIAPRWQMKKGQFADYLALQLRKRNIHQGDLYKNNNPSTDG
jgi:radical SAM protein (TIGR01212 family)